MSIGNYNLKDFATGYALGLAGKPFPLPQGEPTPPQGEPVAYLYNGVRLPKLPEWDMVAYPYAYIQDQVGMGYLYAFREPKHITHELTEGHFTTMASAGETYLQSSSIFKPFTEPKEITVEADTPMHSSPLWANYDILNADGSVHLAASEPVPVYE